MKRHSLYWVDLHNLTDFKLHDFAFFATTSLSLSGQLYTLMTDIELPSLKEIVIGSSSFIQVVELVLTGNSFSWILLIDLPSLTSVSIANNSFSNTEKLSLFGLLLFVLLIIHSFGEMQINKNRFLFVFKYHLYTIVKLFLYSLLIV